MMYLNLTFRRCALEAPSVHGLCLAPFIFWVITSFWGRSLSFSKCSQTSIHASIISFSPEKYPNITDENPIAAECKCVTLPTCSSPSTDNKAKSAYIFRSFIPPVINQFVLLYQIIFIFTYKNVTLPLLRGDIKIRIHSK